MLIYLKAPDLGATNKFSLFFYFPNLFPLGFVLPLPPLPGFSSAAAADSPATPPVITGVTKYSKKQFFKRIFNAFAPNVLCILKICLQ